MLTPKLELDYIKGMFRPLLESDLPALAGWLVQSHIRPHWQESGDLHRKFMEELPARGVHAFVILEDAAPIGFIQYYQACKVGGGWWPDEPPETFGMDLMIGPKDRVGHGLGPVVVRAFVSFVIGREPQIRTMILDPAPDNTRAIRAFEKAGFQAEGEIRTPGGAALLMRLNVAPLSKP